MHMRRIIAAWRPPHAKSCMLQRVVRARDAYPSPGLAGGQEHRDSQPPGGIRLQPVGGQGGPKVGRGVCGRASGILRLGVRAGAEALRTLW